MRAMRYAESYSKKLSEDRKELWKKETAADQQSKTDEILKSPEVQKAEKHLNWLGAVAGGGRAKRGAKVRR